MDAVSAAEEVEGLAGEQTAMAVYTSLLAGTLGKGGPPASVPELGVALRMHSSIESREGRLQAMARALEEMDSNQRLSSSPLPPPKYEELKLKVMILRHVRMCILLFQYETSYREFHNMQQGMKSQGLAREDYFSPKDSPLLRKTNGAEFPRAAEVNRQLDKAQLYANELLHILREFHDVICDMAVPLQSDDDSSVENCGEDNDNNNNNQGILLNIFYGLEEVRRSRSYAAPSVEEIAHYWEIKKWSTSSLKFTHARCRWQEYQICDRADNKPWIFVDEDYVADDCYSMWAEFRLSMAFDEIPEIVWLLKERVQQFSKIHSNDMDDSVILTDNIVGDASRLASVDARIVVAGDAREGRARMDYLCDILSALKMMEPLGLEMMLTPRQAAIHVVLQEHVSEAIWIYNNENCDSHTGVQHIVHHPSVFHDMQMDRQLIETGRGIAHAKSCEDLHEEILRSVEAIKASYVLTPPTHQELDLYYRIAHKMGPYIKIFGDTRGVEYERGLSILKYGMNKIYSKEMEFADMLLNESLKMLQTVFPSVPKELEYTDALLWVHKNWQSVMDEMVAAVRLPNGVKQFEKFLLILEEVNALLEGVCPGLNHGNDSLDRFLHDANHYRSAAEGFLNVFRFCRPFAN